MKVDILGVLIDNVSMKEAVQKAQEWIASPKTEVIYTPNSEIILEAKKEERFKGVLNSASMLIPDGIGVVYGARILKTPLKERVAGCDLLDNLFKTAEKSPFSVYLFGAKPGVAKAAGERMKALYEGVFVVGESDGYFDEQKEKEIIADINEKKPNVLLVCLGAPKQETWIFENRDKFCSMLMIAGGGTLDIYAGVSKRAPKIFIKLGLEWLHRLIKEPWRIKRILRLPLFLLFMMRERLFQKAS